jgi:hypothetical protein
MNYPAGSVVPVNASLQVGWKLPPPYDLDQSLEILCLKPFPWQSGGRRATMHYYASWQLSSFVITSKNISGTWGWIFLHI